MTKVSTRVSAIAAAALLSILGACSSGLDSGASDTADEAVTDVSSYEKAAEDATAPVTAWPGPVDGPAAQRGKKVMWISCGLAAEGCKLPVDAAKEGAETLGWTLRVVDGQFDPKIYNRAVREAIDQDYDAIVLNSISIDAVSEAVKAARAKGIAVGSWDAGNTASDTGVQFEVDQPLEQQGVNMANYLIWKAGGDVKAYVTETREFNVVTQWIGGAVKTLEACDTCSIVRTDNFTANDAATRIPTTMVSALRENSTINTVFGAYDAGMLAAVPAIRSAGFGDDIRIGSFNGIAPMLKFVRDGKVSATSAVPMKWGGYAALDNINRLLAGEEPVAQNIPTRLITTENVDEIPAGEPWSGDVDYQAEFTKIWEGR